MATADQWRDDPIASADEDRLGRVGLAKRIAGLITETYSPNSSVVHGLVGPWGSGKSSVLALVEQELEVIDEPWVVVRFSPWSTSDLNGLLAEFHGALVEALPNSKKANAFKRGLGEVINATAPLASIAGSLIGVAAVGEALNKAEQLLRREKSWAARFDEASEELQKLNVKVLVIADDIDRLQSDELLNFLKLVRLIGRFPGMNYLIAYDEAGLLASIEAAGTAVINADRAHDFLEKFVQYPVYVPSLIDSQILDLLNETLDPIIAASGHRYEAGNGRMSFAEAWTNLLDTPRAINRFGAQLRLVLPLHQSGEVDLVDLILLTLIRLHAPKVFEAIRSRKDLLTGERSSETKFDWEGVIGDRVTSNSVTAVQEVVERLFPATRVTPDHKTPGPRVANAEYFDRYFVQGIPDHDVADYAVQRAIDEANKGNSDALYSLLKGAKSDKQRAAIISKLRRFSKWGEDSVTAPVGALKVLLSQLNRFPEGTGSILPDGQARARTWAGQMLLQLPADVPVTEVRDALAALANSYDRSLLLESVAYVNGIKPPLAVIELAAEVALVELEAALENVRQGDSAERFGYIERWTLLARTVALDDSRARIAIEVAAGISSDDLAARFVSLAHWRGGRNEKSVEIGGFLWDAFHDLLPEGLTTSGPPDRAVNMEDTSWPSRRQYALQQLATQNLPIISS